MNKTEKKKFTKDFVKNFKIESVLNREGDLLPYAFFNPASEGNVTWACGEDHSGNITSVFKYANPQTDEEETCGLRTIPVTCYITSCWIITCYNYFS